MVWEIFLYYNILFFHFVVLGNSSMSSAWCTTDDCSSWEPKLNKESDMTSSLSDSVSYLPSWLFWPVGSHYLVFFPLLNTASSSISMFFDIILKDHKKDTRCWTSGDLKPKAFFFKVDQSPLSRSSFGNFSVRFKGRDVRQHNGFFVVELRGEISVSSLLIIIPFCNSLLFMWKAEPMFLCCTTSPTEKQCSSTEWERERWWYVSSFPVLCLSYLIILILLS